MIILYKRWRAPLLRGHKSPQIPGIAKSLTNLASSFSLQKMDSKLRKEVHIIHDLRFFSTAVKGPFYFWIYSTDTGTFDPLYIQIIHLTTEKYTAVSSFSYSFLRNDCKGLFLNSFILT